MSNPIATLRVRSVRIKGGAEISVIRQRDTSRETAAILKECVAANGSNVAGFACVIWDPSGASVCCFRSYQGNAIPTALIPDFVRNRLLAERIESWTLDAINAPSGPDSA